MPTGPTSTFMEAGSGDFAARLQSLEDELHTHVRDAAGTREVVVKAAAVLNLVAELFQEIPEIRRKALGIPEIPLTVIGVPEAPQQCLDVDIGLRSDTVIGAARGVSEERGSKGDPVDRPQPVDTPQQSWRLSTPMIRSFVGLAVVLVVGLYMQTLSLHWFISVACDLGMVAGIGIFGWLGLIAAFRERNRSLRVEPARRRERNRSLRVEAPRR